MYVLFIGESVATEISYSENMLSSRRFASVLHRLIFGAYYGSRPLENRYWGYLLQVYGL